jgi:hypothetical protein
MPAMKHTASHDKVARSAGRALVAATIAAVLLGGCAGGAGSFESSQTHEEWLHSPSGPFPDNDGESGGHGQTGGHR